MAALGPPDRGPVSTEPVAQARYVTIPPHVTRL
jgi:hypothetical protein